MFLTGEEGQEGEEATLASHHMELYEGFTKCVTFWFWLEAGEDSGVRSLAVFTEDTGGHLVSPWQSNQSTPAWTLGQAGFSRGGDLKIKFRVEHGAGSRGGFVGLDDVEVRTFSLGSGQFQYLLVFISLHVLLMMCINHLTTKLKCQRNEASKSSIEKNQLQDKLWNPST